MNTECGIRNAEWKICTQQPAISNPQSAIRNPLIHSLGLAEYTPTWDAMKRFTAERTSDTRDEIWLVQHPPVYTQGVAGKAEHLLHSNSHGKATDPDVGPCHARYPHPILPPQTGEGENESPREFTHNDIPVIRIDRGGQITYHGPGQIIVYLLLDLRRWKITVRKLVHLMEQAVIDLLGEFGVKAQRREGAPGVYVNNAKIASLGLKIRQGCCYHGMALNVDMNLAPFANINPCGFSGLRVTQCCELGITAGISELQAQLAQNLIHSLQQHFESKQHPQ